LHRPICAKGGGIVPVHSRISFKRFLRIQEVERLLHVPRRTIQRWFKGGEIPGVRIGRQWFVREGDLDNFIRKTLKLSVKMKNEKKNFS
jgi:excisionase family DNA binding protein